MSELISQPEWAEYKSLMLDAHDTFNQKTITWLRRQVQIQRFGEDPQDNGFVPIQLKVLLNYNYRRTWPISLTTETGELDKQSVQVYVNKQYLETLGFINDAGAFNYNPDVDRFIIDGLVWKPVGDTSAAQANSQDILISFILKREETITGDKR